MKFHFVFLFLCFHCNILKADNTGNLLEKTLNIYNNVDDTPPECTRLLESFADYASVFTNCSITYARPVRLCERCIDHYVNFRDIYQELVTRQVNGTTCKSIYLSNDRLDVVLWYHDSISAVWDKGKCNACFDWNMTKPTVSVATTNFTKYLEDTRNCINENNQTPNNTEEVCQKCMMTYIVLDEYYKSLSSDAIGLDSICMDIVDSMNATRSKWSKELGCCKLRKSPETMFLVCSGIISILPFLYYIVVRYCGPIRDLPNVLKQSRFKQRLMRTGNRRIN